MSTILPILCDGGGAGGFQVCATNAESASTISINCASIVSTFGC